MTGAHGEPPAASRVVVVTGASRGIGAGLVTAYRDAGWAVVATARSMPPSGDPDRLTVAGDISEPSTAAEIVAAALDRFGRIDTVVNNAGVFVSKPFTEYTAEDYAHVVGVNMTGFFLLTRLALAHMVGRGSGHIVNVTTTLAEYADSAVPSVLTSLTKGGLAAATKSLAIEYAARGIRVNAVSPGVIRTSFGEVDTYAPLVPSQPMGRVGEVQDVVDAVLFLEASSFITGEILHVDGGRSAGH